MLSVGSAAPPGSEVHQVGTLGSPWDEQFKEGLLFLSATSPLLSTFLWEITTFLSFPCTPIACNPGGAARRLHLLSVGQPCDTDQPITMFLASGHCDWSKQSQSETFPGSLYSDTDGEIPLGSKTGPWPGVGLKQCAAIPSPRIEEVVFSRKQRGPNL